MTHTFDVTATEGRDGLLARLGGSNSLLLLTDVVPGSLFLKFFLGFGCNKR